jgi:hypothetical protein
MSGEEADVNEESATACTCKLSPLTEGYDPRALLIEMKLACFSMHFPMEIMRLKGRDSKKRNLNKILDICYQLQNENCNRIFMNSIINTDPFPCSSVRALMKWKPVTCHPEQASLL